MSLLRAFKWVDVAGVARGFVNRGGSPEMISKLLDQYGWSADCTPNSELITTDKIRLVGEIFDGEVIDTNYWTATVDGGANGTVAQASSELVLTSGTADGHFAAVHSVRRADWVTGTSNKCRYQMRVGDSDDNVTVRFGVGWGAAMPVITDGAYFKLVGATLSANTMADGVETSVASGDFNGTYAAPTLTNNNVYEILYTLGKVFFLINNVLIHTASFLTTHWLHNTTNFHIGCDVSNTGDSDAIPVTFRMMNVCRLGNFKTKPTYKYIAGASAGTVCKIGGGLLHTIVVNKPGTSLTIYDQTSAAVPIIGIIDTTKQDGSVGSISYECPFFNGLTIVTVGAGSDVTVIYE